MMSALLGMTKSELVTLLSPTGQQLTKKTANETGAVRCSFHSYDGRRRRRKKLHLQAANKAVRMCQGRYTLALMFLRLNIHHIYKTI